MEHRELTTDAALISIRPDASNLASPFAACGRFITIGDATASLPSFVLPRLQFHVPFDISVIAYKALGSTPVIVI
jgi:hypothetical protein